MYKLANNQPTIKRERPRISHLTERQWRNFWRRVVKSKRCWVWTGGHNSSGRSLVKLNGVQLLAPRVSYAIHYEVDPGNWDVLHTCDNPSCVSPKHLVLGTPKDNARDMIAKGRFIASRGNTKVNIEDPETRNILLDETLSRDEKSKLLGIHLGHVSRLRRKLSGKDARYKLSKSDVQYILTSHEPYKDMATKFGVSTERVGQIRRKHGIYQRSRRGTS